MQLQSGGGSFGAQRFEMASFTYLGLGAGSWQGHLNSPLYSSSGLCMSSSSVPTLAEREQASIYKCISRLCLVTLTNVPLAKPNHLAKPQFKG